MSLPRITDLHTPVGDVLSLLGHGGAIIESEGAALYAVVPVDDDVLDLLLERNPSFAAHCEAIRRSMDAGQFQTHEQVRKQFG